MFLIKRTGRVATFAKGYLEVYDRKEYAWTDNRTGAQLSEWFTSLSDAIQFAMERQ